MICVWYISKIRKVKIMISSTKTINISAKNDSALNYGRVEKKKSKKLKIFLLLLLIISIPLFFLFNNFEAFRTITIGLNEMEIRYDTFTVSFSELIPDELEEEMKVELSKIENKGKKRFAFVQTDGDIEIGVLNSENVLFEDYLIPVGHLYWLQNSITFEDIAEKEIIVHEGFSNKVESVLKEVLDIEVEVQEVEDVLSYLKENEEDAISFLNFENLNHQYQILYLNDKYFLENTEGGISFNIGVEIKSAPKFLGEVIVTNTQDIFTELDFENILKINMSGVTALSRGLAGKIEKSGDNAYPARKIAEFLGDADIVHTSNEVSFVPNCKPDSGMSFCSHPKYIETLEAINANVIELTGNHNNDFGAQYNAETIEMYKERGWDYYGGGLNSEDAQEILFKELKNSKIAFIGYNYYDTIYNNVMNLAGENRAGANSFSFEKMETDIKKAKEENSLVIVTFQFQECWSYPPSDVIYPPCYKPLSNPDQKKVFRTAVDYGADIVIGSQAHQPQTFEIYNEKPIFYGTGNLFFDQIQWIGTRQGMVLSHYVYENKLLQSKISTTIYDNDMQPYITEGEDRDLLLKLLKEARD